MNYYIVIDGQQLGPYSKEDLRYQNITPDTPAWHEGMADWMPASTIPELAEIFVKSAPVYPNYEEPQQAAYSQPEQPKQMYGHPEQPYGQPQGTPQQPMYGQPQPGQQFYGQPQPAPQQQMYGSQQPMGPQYPQNAYGTNPYETPHTNWMVWAIVTTVLSSCSCLGLILGIISIVYASKANNFYAAGLKAQGDSANSTAKICVIINIVLICLSIIGYILYFGFIASMASLGSL